jgi:hypothetical protein
MANEALAGDWWLWVKDERFGYPKADQPRTHTESDWSIIAAFPTETACLQRVKERIKRPTSLDNFGKERGYQVTYEVTENTIKFSFFEKDAKPRESAKLRGEQIIYHICLPDTVDPRKNSQKK